jgi:hypothetical protein
MATRNKKVQKLSWEAGDFIKKHTSPQYARGIELQNAWEKVASRAALEHTDNVVFSKKNKGTEICVYVDSSHWAAELNTQAHLTRILLEKETGWEIEKISFYVTKKAAFKKIFQKQREQKKASEEIAIPLTQEEDSYARELVAGITNKELQDKLYKAMKADFEWKKGTEGLKLPQKPPESPETT